ncbi:hypothetical protein H310_04553 [Aphanomyces invadans]|uniref:tRNA-uridine aminocarboxypropyltransferase n=1 Tax=Aphanomyces invadans TaxID=157072 RepID=A0A024UCR0_9STRA|nr:hypothetical protein H310_04553 [Aphanomyces invadans]ETW04211.1 hypothetical protein H310_04553 [Aphanomyces invadans]|eukprot:XP_008867167.1 hypothetical protein H310_04553 [Aphanomyces invadans]
MMGKARQTCDVCGRPPCVCFCGVIPLPKLKTRFNVHCIQHPNEAKRKALSSVPLLQHSIENFTLEVATSTKLTHDSDEVVLLLFPGPTATVLSTANWRPNLTLVVVDGTWKEAKKIVHNDPVLQSLPRVVVQSTATSLYGALRKEPMDGCLSTLEAVAQAISDLEGQTSTEEILLAAFESVVARQLDFLNAGIQRTLAIFDGIPKPSPVLQEVVVSVPEEAGDESWYEFYKVQRNVAQTKETLHGVPFYGTHSQAIAQLAQLNAGRTRGNRFGARRQRHHDQS